SPATVLFPIDPAWSTTPKILYTLPRDHALRSRAARVPGAPGRLRGSAALVDRRVGSIARRRHEPRVDHRCAGHARGPLVRPRLLRRRQGDARTLGPAAPARGRRPLPMDAK